MGGTDPDKIRSRAIDNAKTQAEALRMRIQWFIREFGNDGEQLMTAGEIAYLVGAHKALGDFRKREVQ